MNVLLGVFAVGMVAGLALGWAIGFARGYHGATIASIRGNEAAAVWCLAFRQASRERDAAREIARSVLKESRRKEKP